MERANRMTPLVCDILRQNAGVIVEVVPASDEDDMHHATDLVIRVTAGDVAVRVRWCRFRDWTIRAWRATGATTELAKIKAGFARWCFYGWANPSETFDAWMLIDLDKVRATGLLDEGWRAKSNRDGQTDFLAIPAAVLAARGLLSASDGIAPQAQTGTALMRPLTRGLKQFALF
jgi:hypothetical protein